MKLSEFKDNGELLTYFGLKVENTEFIDFNNIQHVELPNLIKENLKFLLANRGDTDMEFYACEALIFPLLTEVWKRHPQIKLFSHPQIKYEDTILVPDYVVTAKDKTGLNRFMKPLLITVEAKNDDYEKGWSDVYKQLVVAHLINENDQIPIYAIVSIGKGWEFGKLDGQLIYRHPSSLGIDNPDKLLGILDFIFADCVKTIEKFDLS